MKELAEHATGNQEPVKDKSPKFCHRVAIVAPIKRINSRLKTIYLGPRGLWKFTDTPNSHESFVARRQRYTGGRDSHGRKANYKPVLRQRDT